MVSQWFKDDNMAMAMGFNISFSRIGSTLNYNITPELYNVNEGYFLPLAIGVLFCVFSFLCGLVLIWMDKESDRREGIS